MRHTPNILMIVSVSLRADRLSCYGYHRDTTPNLDRVAAEGTLFERMYSTAAWTPPAYASLVTGLYPSCHGVCGEASLDHAVPTMVGLFRDVGYHTVGFVQHSNIGSYRKL